MYNTAILDLLIQLPAATGATTKLQTAIGRIAVARTKTQTAVGDIAVLRAGTQAFNGDFETAPASNVPQTAAGWVDGTSTGSPTTSTFAWFLRIVSGAVAVMFDNANARSGSYGMKVSITGTNSRAFVYNNATSTGVPVGLPSSIQSRPSTVYRISYWMKTNYVSGSSGGGGAKLTLQEKNAAGSTIGSGVGTGVFTTTGWTQYTFTYTSSSGVSNYIVPILDVEGNIAPATLVIDAWFDDVRVYVPNEQPAVARIATVPTATQSSLARIAKLVTKTQSATANITTSTASTKTQGAVARIANNVLKSQTSIARVAIALTKSEPAVARVSNSRTKVQSAVGRVSRSFAKTQTATARLLVAVSRTQTATASIRQGRDWGIGDDPTSAVWIPDSDDGATFTPETGPSSGMWTPAS